MLVAQRAQALHVTVRWKRIPLVPVTGSTMIAAIVFGPSSSRISSVRASTSSVVSAAFLNAVIEIGNAEDAGDARLGRPASRIASQRQTRRPCRRDTSDTARQSCDAR